jgi:trans-aconitate methyltransferase
MKPRREDELSGSHGLTPGWDPAKYLEFAGPRLRPALDLLARVPLGAPATVYDLGCGAGNVTRLLAERWPAAAVTGVDGSPAMLRTAREAAPAVTWEEADLGTWHPTRPADLLFSNAALHWLDDHARLFPRLIGDLAPGGVLAVQMPRNHGAPSHTEMVAAAEAGPWRERLRRSSAGGLSRALRLSRHHGASRLPARHLGDRVPARAGGEQPRRRVDAGIGP